MPVDSSVTNSTLAQLDSLQDNLSSILEALQRFRVMFDEPGSLDMFPIDGESSQTPQSALPVVENDRNYLEHRNGATETEFKVRHSSASDQSDAALLTHFLWQPSSPSSFSSPTTVVI